MRTRRSSSRFFLEVRGLRYCVRRWGEETAPPILMLHGTRDTSATFQFVVDHLAREWQVLAPDWRGHGESDWTPGSYWFHEFVADLDSLIAQLIPERRVRLVGHSLGGNIAGIYAGLRPAAVSHLVSLDGFGPLVNWVPVDVPQMLESFLDALAKPARSGSYSSLEDIAIRLRKANPRLDKNKAEFLAMHSARVSEAGRMEWLFDPTHKLSLPSLHTIEEWGSVWSRIRAPALWLSSQDARPNAPYGASGEIERRARLMPSVIRIEVPGTGHNLHHDAPERVARLVEDFVSDPDRMPSGPAG